MEIYLIFLFLTCLVFLALKVSARTKVKERGSSFDLSDISLVVPFRNEERNLPALLSSLLNQNALPTQIIFVNDHSTDLSEQIIQDFISKHQIGQLFSLEDELGKKEALALGIRNVQTNYVLTMDADVVLNDKYMQSISEIEEVDFISLPVIMSYKGFLQGIFAVEFMFFNAFNFLFSGYKLITANGANLLFNVKAVDYDEQLETHLNIASGDDHYLLKTFQKVGKEVHMNNLNNLSVATEGPKGLNDYFNQRIRWAGKSIHRTELLEFILSIFFLIYFIGGFALLVALLVAGNYSAFLTVFLIRLLIDIAAYMNYGSRLRINYGLIFLPFFQIIYPILFMLTVVLSLFKKPTWKDRKLT